MPKTILVDPREVRKPGVLKTKDIPINQYKSDFKGELKKYGKDGLVNMLQDMLLIREFENMLDSFKKTGTYSGIDYNHKGPAHLSAGQESAAVGQSYNLTPEDYIFGSHRSHGEILAKSFSAIRQIEGVDLHKIMKDFMGGSTLSVVEKSSKGDVDSLAVDFILYGALAEIFAKGNGFNKGLGGSMHTFFTPFGSMPNNAIVGGSADIATGSALFKRVNRKNGIVISNIGDASMGCGPVWEGMMLAAMDQYKTLWDKDLGGAPPILFNFFNNFYGMGGQTNGETMGYEILARIGAGVNADAMNSERVDGYNPIAVADAIDRKKSLLLAGKGPVLMDTITYRQSGHSPSDASSYRSKEEMEMWKEADSIESYASYLVDNGVLSSGDIDSMKSNVKDKIVKTTELAVDMKISPRVEAQFIETVMFSKEKVEKFDDRDAEVNHLLAENPRVKSLKSKKRYAFDEKGKSYSAIKLFGYKDALFEAMIHRFYIDPTMIAYGEENRDWGGAFGVYRGLTEALPYHRLFNSPISEGAIVGSGVGYALSGGRAVVELMYCDFMGRAGDEIFNQISKWQSMSAGILKMPLTVRISIGAKYGAQHSQDWGAFVAHIPGLMGFYPATPYDAKGMLNLALSGSDPVIFFESQKLYGIGEEFVKEGVPSDYYEIELGEPDVKKSGSDLTLITLGPALYTARDAAVKLEAEYGVSCELVDLRFISPLNMDKVVESVKKTGRVVLISDSVERGSFMHNVSANITQLAFDYLDAPPVVIGSRNWISPAAEMEEDFFPQPDWIIDAVHERILPLKGHTVKSNYTLGELVRQYKEGV